MSSSSWSSCVAQSDWMFAIASSGGEAGGVRRGNDLQVGQVVTVVARAVGLACRLERVERFAHRAVAQRVEVHLEAGGIQSRDVLLQAARGR